MRRNTRRIFSSEQKIQIVMEALRAEMSIAELCRMYSVNESPFINGTKSLFWFSR
ncbi:MAG TPA: transposase [Flavobacterium sp.]